MSNIYDKDYFNWQKQVSGELEGAQIEAKKFIPFINNQDIVLDFGCGGGYLLSSIPCRRKIGIEINPYARETAKGYLDEVLSDFQRISDNSIDIIISNHALEHVLSPYHELKEMYRVLKENGLLILYVPIDDWRTQKNVDSNDINHHLFTWTPQILFNLVTESGFRVNNARIFTHAWPPFTLALNRYLPQKIFNFLCVITSIIYKRRQICLICEKSLGR